MLDRCLPVKTHYDFGGPAFISGRVPGWLLTVNGAPAARRVDLFDFTDCRHVARTFSGADGLYRFDGINPARAYFLRATDWSGQYNDIIWARVRPVRYDIQALSGSFGVNPAARTLTGGLALVGGDAHVVTVTAGAPPPGVAFRVTVGEPPEFETAGFRVVAEGSTVPGTYTFDLTVTAANGTARTLACTVAVP